jgi:hypothetical protein
MLDCHGLFHHFPHGFDRAFKVGSFARPNLLSWVSTAALMLAFLSRCQARCGTQKQVASSVGI